MAEHAAKPWMRNSLVGIVRGSGRAAMGRRRKVSPVGSAGECARKALEGQQVGKRDQEDRAAGPAMGGDAHGASDSCCGPTVNAGP
jgi:hypothetical protein